MNSYQKLINIVNSNLKDNLHNEITFELYDNLSENLYNFPIENLLDIPTDESFIHEVYFKMLNRPIDDFRFLSLVSALQSNKTTRQDIIKNIQTSDERKIKETNIRYTKKASE